MVSPRTWSSRAALLALLMTGLVVVGCGRGVPRPPPEYRVSIEKWRAAREARLRAEDGWLTLAGLSWLHPGENALGTAGNQDVRLPEGVAPAHAGSFYLEAGRVMLRAKPGSGLTLNGKPFNEAVLKTDAAGEPDQVRVDRILLYLVERGEKIGVRVKDPDNPARRGFRGLKYFPLDPRWRITAEWVTFEHPKTLRIANVIGQVTKYQVPGEVRFQVEGEPYSLLPIIEDSADDQLFFVFGDETNGGQTYAAGRFLDAGPVREGKVVLDFNKAYNPPCAFTKFATCPLPPNENRLPLRIEAGEMSYGPHH